jgi:hypothetical protein
VLGTLVQVIRESEWVVLARVGPIERVRRGDEAFVRFPIEVEESFRGGARAGDALVVESPAPRAGDAPIERGLEAIWFLKAGTPPLQVHEESEPIAVPEEIERRAFYVEAVRGYVEALRSGEAAPLRAHVLRMLRSDEPFLETDAARTAPGVAGWSDAELGRLVAIVQGDAEHRPAPAIVRENLIPTVIRYGDTQRARSLARDQLAKGDVDPVYVGLETRPDAESEAIVRALLDDPDPRVGAGAVQLAGLLRRADLIDAFERRQGGQLSPELRAAIDKARQFVHRDL